MIPAPVTPVSYSYEGAAASVGVSTDVIRRAVRAGDLVAHYPTARPVILRDDLLEWVRRAPTERKAAS